MDFYKKLNIKDKLVFMFIFQMLIPVLIMGSFLIATVKKNMKDQTLSMSQDMLHVLGLRTIDFTENIESVSLDLLYDLELYAVLNDNQEDKFQYITNVKNLKNILRTSTLSNDGIMSITIFNKAGENYSYDFSNGRVKNTNIYIYDNLLKMAREESGKPVWHVNPNEKGTRIYLARLINDIDTFEETGLMVIEVDMQQMKRDYEDLTSNLFEAIYLLEENQKVIFSSNDSRFDAVINYSNNLSGVVYEDESKERLISYRNIETPKWTLVTAISTNRLFKEVNNFIEQVLFIFIPIVLLLTLMTVMEGAHMVSAINDIVSGMKDVGIGKKGVNIETTREDEIGFLAHSFNKMSNEIKFLVENVKTEQLIRKEVEIKALQAQINPHFLYNTLETINWHAQLKGVPEISDMVTALSSIMDATIGRDNKLITLKDEMIYIENYISIIKYRYGGQLTFTKEIDPSILRLKIPRLILQPIIENSIGHGIGKLIGAGEITITASKEEDHVRIEIYDNGAGIETEKMEQLLNDFKKETYTKKNIGLYNVNKRLQLFYGKEYGLDIVSQQGDYTRVTLLIPDHKLSEGDLYYV